MTIETTINGGLPVRASGEVVSSDLEIRFLSGHDYPTEISDQDLSRIAHEIMSIWREGPTDA